jgi:hypothetical protein
MEALIFFIGELILTGVFIVLDDQCWERGKKQPH